MLSLLDALPIARMQRNAEAGRGILECDQLALGMARVDFGARVVVPERLGDVVDEIVGLLGARHPLGGNREGGSVAVVRIGFRRNGVIADDRASVVWGTRGYARVDLGGGR